MDASLSDYRRALVSALGSPFFEGNRIEILRNGVEIFPAMLKAIREARTQVDFLTYVYWTGDVAVEFADALCDAAGRGLHVRVLLDGVGAFPIDRGLVEQMERAGVDVRWFRPVKRLGVFRDLTHRTHRKVLVCDHRVGFTGGVGIGTEWEGDARTPDEWRDTHFRIEGPVVQGLQAAFVGNWLEGNPSDPIDLPPPPAKAGRVPIQVIRSTAALSWSDMSTLRRTLLGLARSSIRISTPYFVPDEPTAQFLVDAVGRGVDVDILVPGEHIDHRVAKVAGADLYEDLLDAGVRIWEYQRTMIHQKVTVLDDALVSIGSANLNHRSLYQDDEVQLVAADEEFAREVNAMLSEDWKAGSPVSQGQWKRRGRLQRLAEIVTRPFRRQM
ncbi:MAG: cardiolipin synthase B [Gemmatimonadetes bacterium]|nr:cardiolipin synthase B [Gemmatimonadota bacterium]